MVLPAEAEAVVKSKEIKLESELPYQKIVYHGGIGEGEALVKSLQELTCV